jgi:hypothetical protein
MKNISHAMYVISVIREISMQYEQKQTRAHKLAFIISPYGLC